MSAPRPAMIAASTGSSSAAAALTRSPSVTSPPAPSSASLFEQLQAAQASSGGTAAAAAILVAKSKELLGLSEGQSLSAVSAPSASDAAAIADAAAQMVPLDGDTKARLLAEGQELQGFAEALMASEGGGAVGSAVSDAWASLADRYNNEGSGLQNEALNLSQQHTHMTWTQLYNSQEAQEISDTSRDLLGKWQAYAATTDGLQLLEHSAAALKSQSGVLAQLLGSVTLGAVVGGGAAAGSSSSVADVSPTNADSSPSARGSLSVAGSSVSGSPSPSPAVPSTLLHKEELLKKTSKVTTALADDDDVKTLMAKLADTASSFSSGSATDDPASTSSKKGDRSPSSSSRKLRSASPSVETSAAAAATGDMAASAMKSGEAYLKNLRESESGHVLLAKASVLLQSNKDMLSPENLTSLSSSLYNDVDARNTFITRIKDVALDFLLSYLPTVVVPPIVGEKGDLTYEINNIDLAGFHVASDNVHVTLTGDSIHIRATRIRCAMKNLLWNYKKNSFPRISGSGTADADASDMDFVLVLQLTYPGWTPPAAPASQQTPAQAKAGSKASKVGSQAAAKQQQAAAQQQQQQRKPPMHAPPAPTPAGSSKAEPRPSASSAASAGSSSVAVISSAAPMSSPVSATAGPAASSSAPPPSTGSAPAGSLGHSILATVSTDLGKPTLVLRSCRVRLNTFALSMSSGWGKSLYNRLLGIFNDTIKSYLQNTINNEIQAKSVHLLDTINALAVEYLPMLQRIMIKATTAAVADEPEDDQLTPATPAAAPSTSPPAAK